MILKEGLKLIEIENILHHLNYRWNWEALALWKGDRVPIEAYRIYEEYEDFISLNTLAHIEKFEEEPAKTRPDRSLSTASLTST